MDRTTPIESKSGSAWRSPWVIGWMVLLLVVLAVNAVMIFLAFATNPGLVRDDYYESGRNVERTIITRQERGPGWTMNIDTPSDVRALEATIVRFVVVDKAGQPVAPDSVAYYAYRPSDAGLDFSLPMVEEAPGRYAARVQFPVGGVWDTLVEARNTNGEYAMSQRVSVAQP
ncbi:MAG: FixH family protein [Thiohalocapsa sp.]